jgi:hypothetical protein
VPVRRWMNRRVAQPPDEERQLRVNLQ